MLNLSNHSRISLSSEVKQKEAAATSLHQSCVNIHFENKVFIITVEILTCNPD